MLGQYLDQYQHEIHNSMVEESELRYTTLWQILTESFWNLCVHYIWTESIYIWMMLSFYS